MTRDAQGRELLGDQARGILLAEALGDLQKLKEKLDSFDAKLDALSESLAMETRREWVALLDSKMREFQHFPIPDLAAIKLQAHSETFLRGVMAEVRQLVAAEVRRQTRHQAVLFATAVFGAGFVLSSLLHYFLK